jgi:DNA polymerase-3 subunit beta
MRITVNQGELEDKLVMASKAVAKKSVKPVLSGFLFDVSDKVFVYATDMETGVRAEVLANEVEGEGKFVVEATTFLEIVKNLPSDIVDLEFEDNTLKIVSGKSRFTLSTMDASEFPEFVSAETDSALEIDTSILEEMVDKVMFAAATDEFMRNLYGVFWELSGNNLRLVASDGFRLALMDQPMDVGMELNFLISLPSMKELKNILSNTSEPTLKLKFDGKRLSVEAGDVEVTMRVVDADFPDYKRVLPETYSTRITVSRDEMLSALKRVMVISKKGSEAVKFTVENEMFEMSSRSPDYGEATEEVEAEIEGENITIAFNPKFIQESLRRIDTPEVELLLDGQAKPLKMKPLERDDYFYIIMPIRIA